MYITNVSQDIKMVENITRAANIIRDKMTGEAKQQFSVEKLGLLCNAVLFERHHFDDEIFKVSI